MNILLHTDDLMSRVRLRSRWEAAGAHLLAADADAVPQLVVIDLNAAGARDAIVRARQQWPEAEVIAFGPHVDADGLRAAREAGATAVVPRGKVAERVLSRL